MAPVLVRQDRQQALRCDPAPHVAQVVPPPAGEVFDAGGDLETTTQQVEVDDDGGGPGRGQPATHGQGEGARAEAAGGPDHGDDRGGG